jgi:hypothetical protein
MLLALALAAVLTPTPALEGPPFFEATPDVRCFDAGRSRCCFRRYTDDGVVSWAPLGCH